MVVYTFDRVVMLVLLPHVSSHPASLQGASKRRANGLHQSPSRPSVTLLFQLEMK